MPELRESKPGVCCVAGVGPGVGLAIARRFAREGFRVAMLARRQNELDAFAAQIAESGGWAKGYAADLSDIEAVRGVLMAVERDIGAIDVLVYNAARWHEAAAMAIDPVTFHRDLALSVTGALACAQAVHPAMKASGRGTMLFTGGGLALAPQYGRGVVSLTAGKSALRGTVYAMADELRGDNIHAATVTIAGQVQAGSAFDPDIIADQFWTLHNEAPGTWRVEHIFDGKSPKA